MIKWFKKTGSSFYGQNIESWEMTWDNVENFLAGVEHVENDHLGYFFKKYFPKPPARILEGGCGTGKYVIGYKKLGYDIHGVDFTTKTLQRLKKTNKFLPLCSADIVRLPYPDDFFDCYYSGGVIEHFEEGPTEPLKEARRVLKKGGFLLATVPYVNLIRKIYFICFKKKTTNLDIYISCGRPGVTDRIEGHSFSEYIFDKRSLMPFFIDAGFHIENAYPVDFLWGEIGTLLHTHIYSYQKQHSRISSCEMNTNKVKNSTQNRIKNILHRIIVKEDRTNLFTRYPVSFLNYLSGHMVLLIAKAI